MAGERLEPQDIGVDHQGKEVVDPVADVRLPHPKRDLLVEQGHHRQWVGHPAVDPDDRDRAAATDEVHGGPERCSLSRPARSMVGAATASGSIPEASWANFPPASPWASMPTASMTDAGP